MANNLTGDYDAVLLLSVNRINGLLATLHQNGAIADYSPSFPHSETNRVGDAPPILHPPLSDYGEWFNRMLPKILADGISDPAGMEEALIDKAPPGAAATLRKIYQDLQAARLKEINLPPPINTRGVAQVQLGVPFVSFPAGSTSQVTIHVNIRAHFIPDPNYSALPEPIHGEVQATYSAKVKHLRHYRSIKTILEVDAPTSDSQIQFISAANTGLGFFEQEQLAAQVRKVVRESFEPVNVELPAGFPFSQFKALGNGQSLALPLRLSPPLSLPDSALSTINNNFLDADFSIAIGKDYIATQLQSLVQDLSQYSQSFTIGYSIFSVTYHVSVSSVTLEWNNGSFDLIVNAKAAGVYDFNITVRQTIRVVLNASLQIISLKASDSDLSIDGIPDFLKGYVRPGIASARNAALPQADSQINNQLTATRSQINSGLSTVDTSIVATFSAVRIKPDGLILDGNIGAKPKSSPVVSYEETPEGNAFTAFKSWIPAGRIDRFEWSWVQQGGRFGTIWGGTVASSSDEHRFVFPKPAQISSVSNICLRIYGIQVDRHGFALEITAGTTCTVQSPVVTWQMPAGELIPIPVWLPEAPLDASLEKSIMGHVNILAHARPESSAANSMVHFVDPAIKQPLEIMGKVLARQSKIPVVLILVLPIGSFVKTRRQLEDNLGFYGEDFNGRILLVEDSTGSWARTFGAKQRPATFLMNARGEYMWKEEGTWDENSLQSALEKYFQSPQAVRAQRVQPSLQIGQPVPRVVFKDDAGQSLSLRKLRGHSILLNFWQSWSLPCLVELQRLQGLSGKGEESVVIAVCGDLSGKALEEVRSKYKLTFVLVPDLTGAIAKSFGINCWPTTLSIHPGGFMDGIQTGIVHHHDEKHAK